MPTAYAPAAGRSKSTTVAEERVRDLSQDAGAVAGVGLGAGGAAVLEVAQGGQGLVDDVVARRSPRRVATKATPQASCSCSRR